MCVYVYTSECLFLKSAHMQDKGLGAPFPTVQCLWSALGRMLLCCAVSLLVPCGASVHALISDLDAVYMPEAVRLHTECSHCAACTFFLSISCNDEAQILGESSNGAIDHWPVSHLELRFKDCKR